MGKASGKSKRSIIRIYKESPEIELLREQFPFRANLQASTTRRDSPLVFLDDYPVAHAESLNLIQHSTAPVYVGLLFVCW
jgi:hypothetical protein